MTSDQESARGLTQLEGFLLWNAEVQGARRRARRLTEQLPWLTTAQRDDLERVYVADRVAASRESLVRIRHRADELREEYTRRYARLRARCVAVTAGALGAAAGFCALLVLYLR
ncbi:hypothetical protein [Streptomyces pratensis]|uniref:hypothetical protein n=1 Tax=Streptomyces pratensis TaxID=1169025 RepID=UPI003018E715